MIYVFLREATLYLLRFSGFHQCGIPHRMCRFYLLLAGAVGKRQGIAIPYPSPTPLLTPEVSAAAGHICCRGGQGYRWLISGAGRFSPLRRGVRVPGVRAEVACVSENHVGLWAFVFHYWWIDCSFLRLRGVLA